MVNILRRTTGRFSRQFNGKVQHSRFARIQPGTPIVKDNAVAQHLIETLQPAAPLAGLQATEIARVEAAVPAFVPDLEPGLSPAEADLDVLLEIPGGADGRVLSGMILEGDPLPPGSPISVDGEAVGELRSCLRSPGLNATIGLGIISSRRALPGTQFSVAGIPATVVAKPFYRRRN